jgi:hypothetical protein
MRTKNATEEQVGLDAAGLGSDILDYSVHHPEHARQQIGLLSNPSSAEWVC